MSLEQSDVEKIANLARLALVEQDIPAYARDLSSILTLVGQLNTADTHQIEPMAHPLELSQRLRMDEVLEGDQREKFQAIAPSVDSGLYLVPKVIE